MSVRANPWKANAAAVLLAFAASPFALRAQDDPVADPGAPERGVARISVMDGEVSVRRGDTGEWVAAALNAPLMVEDRLATGQGARAEVQFDSANLVRVGANAEIRLAQLDYGHYNVQVAHGTVTFRVLRDSRSQVELSTPAVSIRPLQIGAYRVFVQPDSEAEITVRLGQAEIYTPRGSQQLEAGQTMLVRGDPSDPEFQIVNAIARDKWDEWNEERDREMLSSTSYQNVPPDVYGSEDLDNNGRWVDMPSYGEVWTPEVGPDWAPYQNGRWVWEDYYGWTWVSNDPWGWAPFHYGRWFWAAPYGWCWYPGGFGAHYWSPALVAFFGFGPGAGVGFGFGNVGWVALAPFEPLYAWWGRGFYGGYRNPAFFNRGINVTNVSITNVYRNARVGNAVVGLPAGDFRAGHFSNLVHVSPTTIRQAGLVRGQLPVAPTSASLRLSSRPTAYTPRSAGNNVRFFSHNTPAPVHRVAFGEQQRSMLQYSRQPVIAGSRSVTAPVGGGWRNVPSPAARSLSEPRTEPRTVTPGEGSGNSGGWRPINPPPAAAPAQRGSPWQRFGEPRSTSVPRAYPTGLSAPRGYSQPGSVYRPGAAPANNGNRPQSLRVSPSVVHERSTPRSEGGGGRGSHPSGGGSRGGGGGGSHGGGHH